MTSERYRQGHKFLKINIMKVQTFLPVFNGFYNTLFENLIDNAVDGAIEYHNEQNNTDLVYDDFNFNFDSIMQEICKDAVLKIEEKLNEIGIICKIKFETLFSQREYNFSNDSINIEINFKKFSRVIEILEQNFDSFSQYIKEHYTSRDGFISNHSSYASDWIKDLRENSENEAHKVGEVMDFILQEIEEYKDEDLYFDLCENGYFVDYTINE